MLTKKNKFLVILVAALALIALVVPAQAATWDTTRVYTGTVAIYDVAVGNKIKGASDDTVRIFCGQSGSPYRVLLFTDRSSALPMSWSYDSIMVDTAAIRAAAIGDVDRDGDNDLVWGRSSSPYRLKRAYWTGTGWANQIIGTFPSAIYDAAIGDADNDGNADDIILAVGTGVFRARWNGASWDTTRILWNTTIGTIYGVAIGPYDTAYAGNEVVAVTYNQRVYRIRWTGAAWDTAAIYSTTNDFDFYDVAVGDFDASNPGAEIAINNGYNYYQYGGGAVMELYGSGSTWTMRALYTPVSGQWSSSGEIAVGDFYTTNPGAEIIAVSGSTPYEARLVYGSGTTWYTERTFLATSSTYGCAIGNVNRYRPGNEIALTSYYRVFEEEQKLLTNDMAAISIDDMPDMVPTDAIKTLKVTVRNNAEYTANASIPVKLRIDGPLGYVYTDYDQVTSLNLPPGGTEQIIFSPNWNVPDTLCEYTIKAWTEKASDEIPANDTVTKVVTVYRVGGLVEKFTGTTFPPPGWTVYNFGTTPGDAWVRYTAYYYSAPACAQIYYDVPNNDWLITPRVRAQDGDKLKFEWRTHSTSYTETLFVRVSTNPNVSDTGSYVPVDLVTSTGNISWFHKIIDLSSYAGQDIYIAFFYRANNTYGMAIDNVSGPYFPPQIKVVPDSVYAEGYVDSFFDIFFTISNIGGGNLNYTNSLSTPVSWLTIIPTSGSVASGATDTDTLRFNTTGLAGHYYDTLVVTSNSGEKSTQTLVPLHLYVRMIPNIVVSPDSFGVGVEANNTLDTAMFIDNTGNGELNYTVETEEWSKFGALFDGEPAHKHNRVEMSDKELSGLLSKDGIDPRRGVPPAKGLGGPDAFGYRWIDSDEAGGPTFNWIEINSIGTLLSITDDGNVGPFAIGFPFEFYGVTFDSFRVASNGFASFTSTLGNLTNDTIPNPPQPNNLLALMWDDLRSAPGGGAGNIYYHRNSERLVIEWDHVIRYGATNCPYTMEIILYPNGKIIYQYLQMGDGTCTYLNQSTIGIENGTGTDGLEVVFNANYVHNNMAIKFSAAPSWLVFSPESGVIPAYGSDTIDVTFDATGILGGDFFGAFIINSDDPDTPVDTVRAHMRVLVPDMTLSPDSIDTSCTEGGSFFDVFLNIGNTGEARLAFNIVESVPWLSVMPTLDTVFVGDPATVCTLRINCGSLYAGNYIGQLKIYSNDPDFQPYKLYKVYLHVGPEPDIAVVPEEVYVGIYAGYTKDTTMTISNTGAGHLVWGIAIQETGGKMPDTTLYEGFEGATFPPTDWVVVNRDGGTVTWEKYSVYYHTGAYSACSRWESPSLRNDDWLITPRISVGGNDSISFWYRAYMASYPESLEVRLSNTTNDPTAFTTVLWAQDGLINTTWERMSIGLGKYGRGKVYLAFVNKGLDEFRIMVDDVLVESYAGPWLAVDPMSGVINPGKGSQIVKLSFSSIGYEEDKSANLWISSNDPDESPILVPVYMAILGPSYSVSPPETLEIDALENQYSDGHVFMENYGGHAPLAYKITDPVPWLSESPDTADVPIDGAQDVTVTVDGNLLIAGDYATKLFIKTNYFDIPNDTLVVIVHVGPTPGIRVHPDSFRVQVLAGSIKDTTMWVCNDSAGHLAFEMSTEETGPMLAGRKGSTDREIHEILRNWQETTKLSLGTMMENPRPVDTSNPAQLTVLGTGKVGTELSLSMSPLMTTADGETVYIQLPHTPSQTWSFGTTDQGAGYKMHENFWGVTKPVSNISWWGLCLIYTGTTWVAGNPNNMVFDIMFYSDPPGDHTLPTDLVCTYEDVVPTVVPTGIFYVTGAGSFQLYFFTGVELSPICNVPEGWVSIQSQSAGTGGDWLLWASAQTGDGFSYQQGATTPGTLYDRAMIMLGGVDWLTVSPEADTANPHDSTSVTVHLDATNIFGGEKLGNIIIEHNVPDKGTTLVPVHMIVGGAMYAITPHSLDIEAQWNQYTNAYLTISNPGGQGPLSYKMTDPVGWLTENPDTSQIQPDEQLVVTVRVDGHQLIPGNYLTYIAIKSNGVNQQDDTIPVSVHVYPDAEVEIVPMSLNVAISPGFTKLAKVKVKNLGGGPLAFEATVGPSGPKANVLLVDDDNSINYTVFTDVRAYFTAALTANGYTYDVFEVNSVGGNGPNATTMAGYPVVIWFTGESWQLNQTLTPTDDINLAAYLDGGGSLFLSAQDYFYDRYLSLDPGSFSTGDFPYDYLGVTWTDQDVWTITSPATGACVGVAGSIAEGTTFTLWDPYTVKSGPGSKGPDDGLYIDQLQHNGVNMFQMTNPTPLGMAACQYESPKGFKTVFTTVDFAGLVDGTPPSTMADLMGKIMEFLMGGAVGCPFTVSPEADTLNPGSFIDLVLTFDGSVFDTCAAETLTCNLTFQTNDPDESIVIVPVTMRTIRGDTRLDGLINIADIVFLLNYIFVNGPEPVPFCSGDVDRDGNVDSDDALYLISYLFQYGPPPEIPTAPMRDRNR